MAILINRMARLMKNITIIIMLLMCTSLGGCIGVDPMAAIMIGDLRIDLVRTQQIVIKSNRGVFFVFKRIYGKTPDEKDIVNVTAKEVHPNSDADKAGIKAGDEVLEINGKEPYLAGDVVNPFFTSEDDKITFKMKRGQDIYTVTLKPL